MMLGIGVLMMFLMMSLPILLVILLIIFVAGGFQRLIPSTPAQHETVGGGATRISSANQPDTFERYCAHCGAGLKPGWTHCPQCGAPIQ